MRKDFGKTFAETVSTQSKPVATSEKDLNSANNFWDSISGRVELPLRSAAQGQNFSQSSQENLQGDIFNAVDCLARIVQLASRGHAKAALIFTKIVTEQVSVLDALCKSEQTTNLFRQIQECSPFWPKIDSDFGIGRKALGCDLDTASLPLVIKAFDCLERWRRDPSYLARILASESEDSEQPDDTQEPTEEDRRSTSKSERRRKHLEKLVSALHRLHTDQQYDWKLWQPAFRAYYQCFLTNKESQARLLLDSEVRPNSKTNQSPKQTKKERAATNFRGAAKNYLAKIG